MLSLNIETVLLNILYEQPLLLIDPKKAGWIKVKVGSPRLRTFLKGTDCVKCKIKGLFFAVEAMKPTYKNFHLNLYAIDANGNEVMMTSDHVHPKSKGGKGSLKNRVPMCAACNHKKGDKIEEPEN